MVKPTNIKGLNKTTKAKKQPFGGVLKGQELIDKIAQDKSFRDKSLQCYANRLYERTNKETDITFKGVATGLNKDGKPFKYVKLAFDGRESKSRYIAFPCKLGKEVVSAFKSIGQSRN